MPNIVLTAKAVVYYSPFMNSNPAINAWNKVRIAALAESFLQLGRKIYLVFHCQPSGQFNVLD